MLESTPSYFARNEVLNCSSFDLQEFFSSVEISNSFHLALLSPLISLDYKSFLFKNYCHRYTYLSFLLHISTLASRVELHHKIYYYVLR
jgi:hypothetical protein